ncbi:BCCT family transporter [Rothia kristinae]|uniref:BCCT family transporter n=1 Tax=Rothia kristinae TaxID=37923 RepID=UPI001CD61CB4|nr:BCCT family transporter [Rothia kristinae]MCA1169688.1 BCCT family transporter [Rothia kristinae]
MANFLTRKPDLSVGDVPDRLAEKMKRGNIDKRVFIPAAVLMALFIGITLAFPEQANEVFSALQTDVIGYFGWYYTAIVAVFVIFALYLGFSRLGDIKLGPDDSTPDYSFMTWLAFLFAAGMGIGLVFYGASEPLAHYLDPAPEVTGTREQVAQAGMSYSFLHWGLHPWAIYVIVGMAIAYAAHRKKMPLSIRFALKPLLGKRINGVWGDVIDVVALVGVLFGVATSMGLGVMQIASGMGFLHVDLTSNWGYTLIIVVLSAVTLFSVVTGLEKGMKWLSNGNLILAAVIVLFVLIMGPTIFLLREFVQSIGAYLQNVIQMTFSTFALDGQAGEDFVGAWTTFYWGWWISWSAFVGMFIARVSRGRTVREFVFAVLLVPAAMSFFWFAVMGGTALHQELFGEGGLADLSSDSVLFTMLQDLPASTALIIGCVILIIVFFVTSADSGALVLGMISSSGSPNPKTWVRVFWVFVAGGTATALLWAGGTDSLNAIQTVSILTALPFSVVICLMCISLFKSLSEEHNLYVRAQRRQVRQELTEEISETVNGRMVENLAQLEEQLGERNATVAASPDDPSVDHDWTSTFARRTQVACPGERTRRRRQQREQGSDS